MSQRFAHVLCLAAVFILMASASPAPSAGWSDDAEVVAADDPIRNLAFLSGTWRGTMGENDLVEEIWSQASGGGMMGMFRWLNPQGRARMYEMLSISREGEDVLLRLRHFTAEMVAWEDRETPLVMKLHETASGRAVFTNDDEDVSLKQIAFFTIDEAGLGIDVSFKDERNQSPLNFRMQRVKH